MNKKRIGVIALMLSSVLIISASATISTRFPCSASGYDYEAYSTLNVSSTNPKQLAGGGSVATVDKRSVPGGYMMIQSTIVNRNGSLVSSSSWARNKNYANNLLANICYTEKSGEHYGEAWLNLYDNGSDKKLKVTKTPAITKSNKSVIANDDFESQKNDAIFVNENGYTMGNATTDTSTMIRELDFYSAVGVNGKEGYIRASDINGPETIPEIENYDDSSKDIPVYAADGITVIDTFHIYGPEESSAVDIRMMKESLS